MGTNVAPERAFPTGIEFTPVRVAIAGEALTLRIGDAFRPQSVVGTVWKYALDASRTQWNRTTAVKAGTFNTSMPTVPIGSALSADDHLFFIVGTVIAPTKDTPPTPYQVIVSLKQGERELSHEVPQDNGSGSLTGTNKVFVYRLVVVAA
jgi:hypothetical protein